MVRFGLLVVWVCAEAWAATSCAGRFLRGWAEAAAFPRKWSSADVCTLVSALHTHLDARHCHEELPLLLVHWVAARAAAPLPESTNAEERLQALEQLQADVALLSSVAQACPIPTKPW